MEGNPYALNCSADGVPPLLYSWFYKEAKIHEGRGLSISKASRALHNGVYKCMVNNSYGNKFANAYVDIQCKLNICM